MTPLYPLTLFRKNTMLLRINNWRRLFEKACALLKDSLNPIDKITWQTIASKKVTILPLHKISRKDFTQIRGEYTKEEQAQLSTHYPPFKYTTNKLENDYCGYNVKNRIYISSCLKNAEKMKKLLVHEVNHFLNDSYHHYTTNEQMFREELRAFIAAKMTKPGPLTRHYVKTRAQKIARDYALPLPKRVQLPAGFYYEQSSLPRKTMR